MSRRSAFRRSSAPVGRQRWLTLGASAVIATSVVVAPTVATVAAPAAPIVSVQDVTLTADSGLGGILDMLGLGSLTLGDALSLVGVNGSASIGDAVDGLLGGFGSTTLDSLLGMVIPDLTVGQVLGFAGLDSSDTLDGLLAEISSLTSWLGLGLDDISLDDISSWFSLTLPAAELLALGLTGSSTIGDILDSSAVGALLGLDGSLGGTSFGDLLGVTDTTSLSDMVLGFIGVDGDQSIGDAVASLLGLGDGSVFNALGDLLGISGLDASTPLTDLLDSLLGM